LETPLEDERIFKVKFPNFRQPNDDAKISFEPRLIFNTKKKITDVVKSFAMVQNKKIED